jgi:hypothetical protein
MCRHVSSMVRRWAMRIQCLILVTLPPTSIQRDVDLGGWLTCLPILDHPAGDFPGV